MSSESYMISEYREPFYFKRLRKIRFLIIWPIKNTAIPETIFVLLPTHTHYEKKKKEKKTDGMTQRNILGYFQSNVSEQRQ